MPQTKEVLSLAEEVGIIIEEMKAPEKEDFIQSFLYLLREEEPEEAKEQLNWEVTSTSVASVKVSILIDYLLDLNLIKYSSNPGYFLTDEGRRILLNDISPQLRAKYGERCKRTSSFGDNTQIMKIAKEKYLRRRQG
jgi:hypothetical protein